MSNPHLPAEEAIAVLVDMATRYTENAEEVFPRRITCVDTDEEIAKWADQGYDEDDLETAREIRDCMRALMTAQAILDQQGCEHLEGDGSLTSLIDTVVFG